MHTTTTITTTATTLTMTITTTFGFSLNSLFFIHSTSGLVPGRITKNLGDSSSKVFTGRIAFLSANQHHQSTEGTIYVWMNMNC